MVDPDRTDPETYYNDYGEREWQYDQLLAMCSATEVENVDPNAGIHR